MKKNSLLALMLALVLVITGCSGPADEPRDKEKDQAVENLEEEKDGRDKIVVRSLKGPTSMGMIKLIDDEKSKEDSAYDMDIVTMADEVVGGLAKKEIDIAALPANLASVLYNKTDNVEVLAINTLGVVYLVENGDSIKDFSDLKGKTIYATGEGQTPDLILRHLLKANNLEVGKDVNLEFKQEPAEVAAILAEKEDSIALLPEPFISAASMKNDKIRIGLDLNEEWKKANDGKDIVTGVVLARKDFIEENKDSLEDFLKAYKESVDFVLTNKEEASKLIDKYDIVKEPVALKALEKLNISFIDGDKMKDMLSSYLEIISQEDPKAVGGSLPGPDFYYGQ